MERGRVLEMNSNKNSGFTFSGFLCGAPQGDYIFQNVEYYKQIKRAAEIISDADYILIGAGAGLSTAAGAEYGGKWFEENFAEFRDRYGTGPHMQDMYSAGFYPFPDEEAFWGYWSKHALLGGVKLDVTPLHKVLLSLCEGKHLFVLSTNVDGQFVKAGLPADQIFCTRVTTSIFSVPEAVTGRCTMRGNCSPGWMRLGRTAVFRLILCLNVRSVAAQ